MICGTFRATYVSTVVGNLNNMFWVMVGGLERGSKGLSGWWVGGVCFVRFDVMNARDTVCEPVCAVYVWVEIRVWVTLKATCYSTSIEAGGFHT